MDLIGYTIEKTDRYEIVTKMVEDNGGYCPCAVQKTEDTKCICKEFREQREGMCRCGRYRKEKMTTALETTLTESQQKIVEITEGMKDLLLYKNGKYGDSALNPKGIFYKGDSTNSILIRLDDKLGRVISNPDEKPRVNDVADIIGYCTLLLISMGVTRADLAKFMD